MHQQRRDKHPSAVSVQTPGALTAAAATPEKSFKKMWVDHTGFTVTVCHEYRPCVLLTEERATVTTHTHTNTHQHTHLYIEANISHSLAAARTTIQLNFPPWHTHTHTMKLIDYFTKNQLGAGYVRTLRAKEGRAAANSKRGGRKGEKRGEQGRDVTDLLHMKIKCGECNSVPERSPFDTAVFFFSADMHTAAVTYSTFCCVIYITCIIHCKYVWYYQNDHQIVFPSICNFVLL